MAALVVTAEGRIQDQWHHFKYTAILFQSCSGFQESLCTSLSKTDIRVYGHHFTDLRYFRLAPDFHGSGHATLTNFFSPIRKRTLMGRLISYRNSQSLHTIKRILRI